MSAPTAGLSEPSTWETAEHRKAAAREAFRDSVARGTPLAGVQLGPMFGRSARWGTDRITEVQAEDIGNGRRDSLLNGSNEAGSSINSPRGETSPQHPALGTGSATTGNGHHDEPNGSSSPISNDARIEDSSQPAGARDNSNRDEADDNSLLTSNGGTVVRGNDNNWFLPERHAGNFELPIGNDLSHASNGTDSEALDGETQPEAVPATPKWVRVVTVVAAVAVGLAAATASVEHIQELAVLAGEGRPWLLPLSVDGLVVAATMSLYLASRAKHPAGAVTWLAFGLGLGASIIGNVIAKNPDLVPIAVLRVIVAAWPPVSLALTLHLLLDQIRSTNRSVAT